MKIIINSKTDLSAEMIGNFIKEIMDLVELTGGIFPRYLESKIDNKTYTVIHKTGVGSHIFTIEYTGYEKAHS